MTIATTEELQEASDKLEEVAESQEDAENDLDNLFSSLQKGLFIQSEHEIVKRVCKEYNINASQAKRNIEIFPPKYQMYEQDIPAVIKTLRKERRSLKGQYRDSMTKSIDSLIEGYSEHIDKCIDSLYWLHPYKTTLRKMTFKESDLRKLHSVKEAEGRRNIVDSLCKYWEADLDKREVNYGRVYASLDKDMRLSKSEFRKNLKQIPDVVLRKNIKEKTQEFILKEVCDNQGISARQIHDRMPSQLYDRNSWNTISKISKGLDIVSLEGKYYKLNGEIKKNIWAYTAAFIDSDGYITMDRKYNPRVGLVATGDRGKVFMQEIHKAIGFGKLHLDQKSPQNTRPVNRLNFYSQDDVYNLLVKCLPHFRMKGPNAQLLLELVRIKKGHKKTSWYKDRCGEIFKLMKWENHRDHVGFDFEKEGIYKDDIQKYRDNCKMSVMDSLEQIGGMVLKQKEYDPEENLKKYGTKDRLPKRPRYQTQTPNFLRSQGYNITKVKETENGYYVGKDGESYHMADVRSIHSDNSDYSDKIKEATEDIFNHSKELFYAREDWAMGGWKTKTRKGRQYKKMMDYYDKNYRPIDEQKEKELEERVEAAEDLMYNTYNMNRNHPKALQLQQLKMFMKDKPKEYQQIVDDLKEAGEF
tara:strand:+ start:889 stop:2808 length:1920 start_codon:yes stop_codon:yes gene_type:complete